MSATTFVLDEKRQSCPFREIQKSSSCAILEAFTQQHSVRVKLEQEVGSKLSLGRNYFRNSIQITQQQEQRSSFRIQYDRLSSPSRWFGSSIGWSSSNSHPKEHVRGQLCIRVFQSRAIPLSIDRFQTNGHTERSGSNENSSVHTTARRL